MKFKWGLIGITIGSLLTTLPIESLANSEIVQIETYDTMGWQKLKSAVMETGWLPLGNTWYYLNESGDMVTGWEQIGGTWYYFDESGAMQTGWLPSGSTWYYLNESGAMVTGWEQIGGTWYYFDESGVMQTGWLPSGSTWYYLNESGAMVTGWEKVNGKWYYFNPSGVMQTGWLPSGSTWYYLSESGAMVTGWEQIRGTWYYFYSNGAMAINTVIDGWNIDEHGIAKKIDVNDLESNFLIQVENLIVEKVNRERLKQGVPILCQNTLMQSYARLKAKDMGDRDYFSHENPEGELVIDFMKRDDVPYFAWGENIAYIMSSRIDFSNPDELAEQFVTNWMNSQGHRKNILSIEFESIGVGLYKVDNQYYAVQEFYR